MKKVVVVVSLVLFLAFGAAYVFAAGYGPGLGKAGFRGGPAMARWGCAGALSLTEEQKAKLDGLRKKYYDETAELRRNMATKREELRKLWSDPSADPKAIAEKDREMRQIRDQIRDRMIQFRLEARNLLTPDQISKINTGCARFDKRGGRCFGGRW